MILIISANNIGGNAKTNENLRKNLTKVNGTNKQGFVGITSKITLFKTFKLFLLL